MGTGPRVAIKVHSYQKQTKGPYPQGQFLDKKTNISVEGVPLFVCNIVLL